MATDTGLGELTHGTVYVEDMNDALEWYTEKLGFEKMEDEETPQGRWLTVSPGNEGPNLVLMEPEEGEENRVGDSPMWVVSTEDCEETTKELERRGVRVIQPPVDESWGTMSIIVDLYGNPFCIGEPDEEH
ncbi:MAG: VOC family protein [Halobacteria archaeon]